MTSTWLKGHKTWHLHWSVDVGAENTKSLGLNTQRAARETQYLESPIYGTFLHSYYVPGAHYLIHASEEPCKVGIISTLEIRSLSHRE